MINEFGGVIFKINKRVVKYFGGISMKKTVKKIVSFSLAIFIVAAIPFAGLETTNLFDAFTIRAEAANEYTEGNYMYTVDDNGDATITSVASSLMPSKSMGILYHRVILMSS